MTKLTPAQEKALDKLTNEWQVGYDLCQVGLKEVRLDGLNALVKLGYAERRACWYDHARGNSVDWFEYRKAQDGD